MGERKEEVLEWLMIPGNASPQPSPNGFRTINMPENNRRLSLPSSANNSVNRVSSWPLNRSVQLPLHENNPYYPSPANNIHAVQDTTNNTNNVIVNPTYPDSSFYDFSLETQFNQLDLSPLHQSPTIPYAAGQASALGSIPAAVGKLASIPPPSNYNNSFGNAQFSIVSYPPRRDDRQRMRVDSGVRGQMGGFYIQPHAGGYINTTDDDVLNLDQEWDNLRLRQPGYVWAKRNGTLFHPDLGYLFPNNDLSGRNGVIKESPFDIMPSSFYGSRQNFSSLEELRSKIFSSLEELKGKLFIVAKDQIGGRDLQTKLGEGKPEEQEMIFSELKDHVRELMTDQFANYLAQKMFEVSIEEQITELLLLVISDERELLAICLDVHGTRAMQKLLGHLTTQEQRSLVISALRRIAVTLTKSTNGHHVVEHCLKYFPNKDKTCILNIVADNCLDIATDKSGCCVLQQCVEHARGDSRDRLVSEIISNVLVLSEHPYGNYVVQFLIGLRIQRITSDILAQLAGNYVSLSMNKYASNVVEKCMKESSEEQAMQIINEIIGSQNFLTLLQDPFGNYVAQSAVSIAKGSIRLAMMNLIQMHYSYLHSHPHGKRVLARARVRRQRV